jgi:hypothetical protein
MRDGRLTWFAAALAGGLVAAPLLSASDTSTANAPALEQPAATSAEQAWADLQALIAAMPSAYPEAWQTNRPSPQAYLEYRVSLSRREAAAAQKSRDFYARYPDHTNAPAARLREEQLLVAAAQMGYTQAVERLNEIEVERLSNPALSPDERFDLKARAIRRQMMRVSANQETAKSLAACEQVVRALQAEFPARPEPWEMLLDIAGEQADVPARTLARDIAQTCPQEDLKRQAGQLLKRLDWAGKPLKLKFTTLDKKTFDLEALRGKVVLVVFWASWCGPYVAGVDEDLAGYEKWHAKGLEVVGICLDKNEAAASRFIQDRQIPWPQYFDGQAWLTKWAVECGITQLPTFWLIDKSGIVRDLRARPGVESKIEKLLTESL